MEQTVTENYFFLIQPIWFYQIFFTNPKAPKIFVLTMNIQWFELNKSKVN